MDMDTQIRPEREYTIEVRCTDDGGEDTLIFTVPAGTVDQQDTDARAYAAEMVEEWVREGAWGDDGTIVAVTYRLVDDDAEWDEVGLSVEIEPAHDLLIHYAVAASARRDESCGDDPADHDWTADGEGGCDQNPGVWSTGGTAMQYSTHCTRCGLHRVEYTTGAQHNPGGHDRVEYTMPDEREPE